MQSNEHLQETFKAKRIVLPTTDKKNAFCCFATTIKHIHKCDTIRYITTIQKGI